MSDDGSPLRYCIDQGRRLLAGLSSLHPARLVFLGYLSYIVVGWLLLCLPISQKVPVGALDNLFIATSAISTTGLVTVSVSDSYTFFGQLIVLSLIQFGGIGYMTLGSFLILSRKTALSEVRLAIGRSVFSLPESFRLDKFVVSVIRFTFAIELAGAAVLFVFLWRAGDPDPLWTSVDT